MLRDITLGQYFPIDSPVHRLDPRVKLALTLFYIVTLFLAKGPVGYGLIVVFLLSSLAFSRIRPVLLLKAIKPLLFVIILTSALNILYTPGDTLWSWGILRVTREGLVLALVMSVRIVLLIAGTAMLTYTTSPIMLTDALELLLSPLKKIRLPVHELSMMMSIALRFIPTLIEETEKIMNAQKSRGADFETGGPIKRAKAFVPLLVPLFVGAFRRADELAMAMESRCYRGGEGRTRLRVLRLGPSDALVLVGSLVLFALVVVAGSFGL